MQILAFDSSALTASVALWRDGEIAAEISSTNGLNHSVRLLPLIDGVLRMADTNLESVDAFGISVGPGSFTGVRIGISTLKGLAFGTDALCVPVSTLEALAFNECNTPGIICAVMDARRGEFYNSLFSGNCDGYLNRLSDDRAITASDLLSQLNELACPVTICGDGANLFYQYCGEHNASFEFKLSLPTRRFQRAASVACLASQMLANGEGVSVLNLAPLYLRASGAERKRGE